MKSNASATVILNNLRKEVWQIHKKLIFLKYNKIKPIKDFLQNMKRL